ncbi:hypothetical protein BKD30_08340 [Tersicoccus phoenicis]|uniref:Uncharacterized protein n=1 Tax=Tersicoccus phoenicis TaxID=554083 RepID=A0A1R1LAL8_9MICC|nr:hypothetical protein BKD30_08340 [Tersicoccus phoenicis]
MYPFSDQASDVAPRSCQQRQVDLRDIEQTEWLRQMLGTADMDSKAGMSTYQPAPGTVISWSNF